MDWCDGDDDLVAAREAFLGRDVDNLGIVVPTDARQRIAHAADQLVSVADLTTSGE